MEGRADIIATTLGLTGLMLLGGVLFLVFVIACVRLAERLDRDPPQQPFDDLTDWEGVAHGQGLDITNHSTNVT